MTAKKEKGVKTRIAKTLAPVADSTARNLIGLGCAFIFHQPKLPKKLQHTVK